MPHISSGDIFRENLKNQTELGQEADGYMKRGELVPDDITIAMIRERLSRPDCQPGALLDGFPRTPAQADALAAMLAGFSGKVDAVPYISVAEEVLVERLTGRWTCRARRHIFHEKFNPPKVAGRCDLDGSELYQRDDDKAETVKAPHPRLPGTDRATDRVLPPAGYLAGGRWHAADRPGVGGTPGEAVG